MFSYILSLFRVIIYTGCIFVVLNLAGCNTSRPDSVDNICKIFKQYPSWYWIAQETEKRWGTPIYVLMAIIHQESRFNADARPERTKLLWIIPWSRKSTAYGYGQALKQTWKRYLKVVGKDSAERDSFSDSADFMGWYIKEASDQLGISQSNAYSQYIAYHEGVGGYQRKTYRNKEWLLNVAKKVQSKARIYYLQLNECRDELKNKPWYRFW